MKINNQPKAQMHEAGDSVDTGALQGARRATEDAPVSARSLPNVAALPMQTSAALWLPPQRAPSPVKSVHFCVAKAFTHLHWPHGDANMRQASSMEPTPKDVVPKWALHVKSSSNWR